MHPHRSIAIPILLLLATITLLGCQPARAPTPFGEGMPIAESRQCEYAASIYAFDTQKPVEKAKVTLQYKQHQETARTDSEGYQSFTFPCDEPNPRFKLRIEAMDYAPYNAEFTLADDIKLIYLDSLQTALPTATPALFPPRAEGETLVLVADFRLEDGRDPNRVTQKLVNNMREKLQPHPKIRVERLHQFIEEDGGSDYAMQLGQRPEFDATFVIWGDYALEPEPELYVYFDIVQQRIRYLGNQWNDSYSPSDIQQPSMFEFKVLLGSHLGQLTAFATGLTLYQASQHKEAEALFNTAGQAIDQPLTKEMADAILFYRGTNYLYLGRANKAKPDLAQLVESIEIETIMQNEFGPTALGNLGIAYENLGQYKNAIQKYEDALAIAHKIGDRQGEGNHLGNLGNAYLSLGQYQDAIQKYEDALAIAHEIGDRQGKGNHLGNLGNAYRNLEQYQNAIQKYEDALVIAQDINDRNMKGSALGNLGNVYLSLGRYQDAIQQYKDSLAIAQYIGDRHTEGSVLGNMGIAYADLGKISLAKQNLAEAIKILDEIQSPNAEVFQQTFKQLSEDPIFYYLNRGSNRYGLGRYEWAVASYEIVIGLNPKLAIAYQVRGAVHMKLAQYAEAIDDFTQVIELEPENSDAYYWRGQAHFQLMHEVERWASDLKMALSLEPNNSVRVFNSLCWYYGVEAMPEEALSYCEQAVENASENEINPYRDSRGLAYAQLGDDEKAIADFQAFVDWAEAQEGNRYDDLIQRRQEWIVVLEAGDNPFTGEVLAELRAE